MASLVGLQGVRSSAVNWPGQERQAALRPKEPFQDGIDDRLELSAVAKGIGKKQTTAPKALPVFGRIELGGPEPLPFGPDLKVSILNRIPGDGFETPPDGVQLGHQPARGLNILA
jgi:hypothetical protein